MTIACKHMTEGRRCDGPCKYNGKTVSPGICFGCDHYDGPARRMTVNQTIPVSWRSTDGQFVFTAVATVTDEGEISEVSRVRRRRLAPESRKGGCGGGCGVVRWLWMYWQGTARILRLRLKQFTASASMPLIVSIWWRWPFVYVAEGKGCGCIYVVRAALDGFKAARSVTKVLEEQRKAQSKHTNGVA